MNRQQVSEYFHYQCDFTRPQVERLIDLGWFDFSVLDDVQEEECLDPFSFDDELGQSHILFQFILEKTFGKGSNVAGVEELEDVVLLNIAYPV